MQENNKIVQTVITGVGTLLGEFFAFLILPKYLLRPPGTAEVFRDSLLLALGALLGGLFFSWASKR